MNLFIILGVVVVVIAIFFYIKKKKSSGDSYDFENEHGKGKKKGHDK